MGSRFGDTLYSGGPLYRQGGKIIQHKKLIYSFIQASEYESRVTGQWATPDCG
jgi:hypothetical protein